MLTGSAPSSLSLTAGTATLTITDNDAAPTAVTLAVNPASAAEHAEATAITVTASLNGSQRTEDTAVTVSRTGGTGHLWDGLRGDQHVHGDDRGGGEQRDGDAELRSD